MEALEPEEAAPLDEGIPQGLEEQEASGVDYMAALEAEESSQVIPPLQALNTQDFLDAIESPEVPVNLPMSGSPCTGFPTPSPTVANKATGGVLPSHNLYHELLCSLRIPVDSIIYMY